MAKTKKIYVAGALTHGAGRERRIYEKIGELAGELGIEAYVPHLAGTDPKKNPEVSAEEVWQNNYQRVAEADAIVAYAGQPTTGTGTELEIARQNKSMIILWWFAGEKVSRMARGNPAVKAKLEVKSEDELYAQLKKELIGLL